MAPDFPDTQAHSCNIVDAFPTQNEGLFIFHWDSFGILTPSVSLDVFIAVPASTGPLYMV